jgi:hypothetical protein
MRDSFNSRYRSFSAARKVIPTKSGDARTWIPAPAQSRRAAKVSRQSFPLCLVCDKDWNRRQSQPTIWGDDVDVKGDLAGKFEANSALLKELDASARLSGERQRLKVMKDLWEMDGGSSGQKLQKWHDILTAENQMFNGAKESADHHHRRRDHRQSKTKEGERKSRKKQSKRAKESPERNKKCEVDQKNLTESMSAKMLEKDGIGDKINREELLECLDLIERSMASTVADAEEAAKEKKKTKTKKRERRKKEEKEVENDSTDISQSLRDEGNDKGVRKKTESDFFIEVIIDELKKENRDFKFDLIARDRQLEKAAEKVREMVEENAKLAKKFDKAAARAQEQAENYGQEAARAEEGHARRVSELEERLGKLETLGDVGRRRKEGMEEGLAVAEELRKRLEDSEKKNANLENYVEELKKSYEAVFGEQQSSAGDQTVEKKFI